MREQHEDAEEGGQGSAGREAGRENIPAVPVLLPPGGGSVRAEHVQQVLGGARRRPLDIVNRRDLVRLASVADALANRRHSAGAVLQRGQSAAGLRDELHVLAHGGHPTQRDRRSGPCGRR